MPTNDSTLKAPESPQKTPESPGFGSSSTNPFEQDSLTGSLGANETEYFSLIDGKQLVSENDPFEHDVDTRRQSLSTNAIKRLSQESANRSISPLEMFQNLSGKNLKCFRLTI